MNKSMKLASGLSGSWVSALLLSLSTLSHADPAVEADYAQTMKKIETLKVYNRQLEAITVDQEQQKLSLKQQMQEFDVTEAAIVPLLDKMTAGLESFIAQDLPFNPKERADRIEGLKNALVDPEKKLAEKFRRVLEAYEIENEFGRTLEAYKQDLDIDGQTEEFNILRVGRIGLYYQSTDSKRVGVWNIDQLQWQPLSNEYRRPISKAIRIAERQAAPALVEIAIPAAVPAVN